MLLTFASGATPFSVPGHDLVLKVVRADGEQRFLLGDPKGDSFEKYTPDALAEYLAKYDLALPFDPFPPRSDHRDAARAPSASAKSASVSARAGT